MKPNIIAVDFDGTLCENKWPEIGMPNEELIEYLKKRQANGEKLILWTNRVGNRLDEAVKWSAEKGLVFDAVNENLPEIVEAFSVDSRKIFANEYIDDRNRLLESCREKSNTELWAEDEVMMACKHEAPNRKDGEWDYGCACYESALKAFRSLCEDGHSCMSIGFTKAILNRLIDCKPLLPIEDTEDTWNLCTFGSDDGVKQYQYVSYQSGLIDRVMGELFPITMPYIPFDKPFKVYTEDFLTDAKNGDYDTTGLLYTIDPHGNRIEINRYFKDAPVGFDEIGKEEYEERRELAKKRQEELKNGSK